MNTPTIEDVLKKHYELVFGTQKYEKSNLYHTYRNVTEAAMQEWASLQTPSNDKYWRERCEAAEALNQHMAYDNVNPCNDYNEFDKAYEKWEALSSTPIPIQTPCGWLKVEDGLPEESEWVLTYCQEDRNHFERCCVAKVVDKQWFEYDGNHKNEPSVTHWMPLPTKPNDI